jgi:single-stranded-DNA-specific exonuclease
MLAGVGVAFKFCEALVKATLKNERKGSALQAAAQSIDLEGLLDLVAIGTIADLAPMDKLENRLLVRRGLHVLNRAERPGIRALLEAANVNPGSVDSTAIGFSIGPRINAAGRLESAMLAYELLLTRDHPRAVELAAQLHELNTRRQELTRDAQEMVRHELALNGQTNLPLIFASHTAFPQGVVGLVAGRLTEEYFRPSVVVQRGTDESHGSCRSIPQFDITQALDQCSDLLLRHGGHAQAAGFTILNGNLTLFRERMTEIAAQQLYGQDLRPMLTIDGEADIHHLSEALYEELQQLQPTGHENPPPVLMSTNLHITDWRLVGKDEKHLKLRLTRAGQPPLDAIGFNLGEWAAEMPARIDAAYELDMNEWNGKRTLQLNLKDIRAAR